MAREGFPNTCAVQCMANQPAMQVIFMENGSNPLQTPCTEPTVVLNLQQKPNVFSILVGFNNNNSECCLLCVQLSEFCGIVLSNLYPKNNYLLVKVQKAHHLMTMYVHFGLLFFNLEKCSGLPKINIFPAS